jgi:hypothetical protein
MKYTDTRPYADPEKILRHMRRHQTCSRSSRSLRQARRVSWIVSAAGIGVAGLLVSGGVMAFTIGLVALDRVAHCLSSVIAAISSNLGTCCAYMLMPENFTVRARATPPSEHTPLVRRCTLRRAGL